MDIFNITDNITEERYHLTGYIERQVVLDYYPQKPTHELQSSMFRISTHGDAVELCMATRGMVPHGSSTVSGFPASVTISFPKYMLPMFLEAVNQLK